MVFLHALLEQHFQSYEEVENELLQRGNGLISERYPQIAKYVDGKL